MATRALSVGRLLWFMMVGSVLPMLALACIHPPEGFKRSVTEHEKLA